jgi:hypothetical protein
MLHYFKTSSLIHYIFSVALNGAIVITTSQVCTAAILILLMAEVFSSTPCVQTGSGAHPASYSVGSGGPFPGCKAQPGRDADHSPHLVLTLRVSRSYTSSPPMCLHGV